MAVLTAITELCLVDRRMTGDTLGACARRTGVALVVTSLALRLGVAGPQAQPGVIAPDVRDLGPVGLVVARSALRSTEPTFVGIFVAGHTVGPEPEKGRVSATIAPVVTLFALHGRMSALKRPAREPMIKARLAPARPANEPRVPSQMLDVAPSALLPSILGAVEPGALTDASRQVVMATETRIGIDSLARRVALAAVRVALELGVRAAELSRGKELSACWSGD